jgi:hypothetical protein
MRSPDSAAPSEYSRGKPFIAGNLALQAEGQEVFYRKWEIRSLNADGSISGNPSVTRIVARPIGKKALRQGWMADGRYRRGGSAAIAVP